MSGNRIQDKMSHRLQTPMNFRRVASDMSVETADGAGQINSTEKPISTGKQLALSAFWLGANLHWLALYAMIPSQMKTIDPQHPLEKTDFVLGCGSWVALFVPLLAGAFSDRCTSKFGRRRPWMLWGTVINLIGLAAMFFAGQQRQLPFFLIGFLIVQLGNNAGGAAFNSVIPDLVPKAQHGEASGFMGLMMQVGSLIGAYFGGQLMDKGLTLQAYLMVGISLILSLGITASAMNEVPLQEKPAPIDWGEFVRGLWIDPRKHPDFFWVWVTRFFFTMGIWLIFPNLLFYMTDIVHAPNPEASNATLNGIILIAATITGFLGGKISDKIGRKKVVYIANTLVALAVIAFLFSTQFVPAILVGIVFGLGYGAYVSVDWALGVDVLPNPEETAKDMGVWHVAFVLPQGLAPMIAGTLFSIFGKGTVAPKIDPETKLQMFDKITHAPLTVTHYGHNGYLATFILSAIFMLMGALFLRNVREKKDRMPATS